MEKRPHDARWRALQLVLTKRRGLHLTSSARHRPFDRQWPAHASAPATRTQRSGETSSCPSAIAILPVRKRSRRRGSARPSRTVNAVSMRSRSRLARKHRASRIPTQARPASPRRLLVGAFRWCARGELTKRMSTARRLHAHARADSWAAWQTARAIAFELEEPPIWKTFPAAFGPLRSHSMRAEQAWDASAAAKKSRLGRCAPAKTAGWGARAKAENSGLGRPRESGKRRVGAPARKQKTAVGRPRGSGKERCECDPNLLSTSATAI
jgi:hypothetical protein